MRPCLRRFLIAGVFLGAPCLGGCGGVGVPTNLFVIEAEKADYPVMLSQGPAVGPGRPVTGSSGRGAEFHGRDMDVVSSRESETSACEQIAGQIQRGDRWMRIDRARYHAEDSSYGIRSSFDRDLTVEGTVYR